jgi:sugar transferase (PEP-CTERM/EpsH1 system associated)
MDVLFLSQIVPYPPHGGVLQRGYNVIRELHKQGEVHLLAFLHPDTLTNPQLIEESREMLGRLCASVEYFPLWPKRNRFTRVAALMVGAAWPQPFSVLAHRSSAFRSRIAEQLATRHIDIVHFDTIGLAQYDDVRLPYPRIVTHHNIESKLMERRASAESSVAAQWYVRSQARRLLAYEAHYSPRFDVNIVMSALDAEELQRIAPGAQMAVVPNGVDIEYFVPRPGEETQALIYTGGMNMFANRDAVLYFLQNVWPQVRAAIPKVTFYVVGQDPPAELRRLAAPGSGVIVTGYVSDVRPYVAKSAVYVVPLRVGGGTRLKVVDAMAQGKAIVSTSVGCEGIDVSPDRNIAVADEPDRFAERVIHLLRTPSERARLGTAARSFVETYYAWPVIGRRLRDAYQQANERSRRRLAVG